MEMEIALIQPGLIVVKKSTLGNCLDIIKRLKGVALFQNLLLLSECLCPVAVLMLTAKRM